MRTVLCALAVAALAGCATRTMEQDIAAAPNIELCEAAMYAGPKLAQAVQPEIQRRGLNCRDLDSAIQFRQQQRAIAAGSRQPVPVYTPYQVPVPPPVGSRQTTCTSQVVGNQVQTVCR